MGLTMLLVVALLILVCVLLTVLVVSLSATQRTLVADAESANRLLLQIRECLESDDYPMPMRRAPMLHEAVIESRPGFGRHPEVRSDGERDAREPGPRPVRDKPSRTTSADSRAEAGKRRDPDNAANRPERGSSPARSTPADGRTDVYVSTERVESRAPAGSRASRGDTRTDVQPKADSKSSSARSERKGRPGDSTDVFKSV